MKRSEIRKLDKFVSQKIREKGYCEWCGKRGYLHTHHIFSRSNRSVRWHLPNLVALCPSCHTFGNRSAHKAPLEFAEWLKEVRGEEWYNDLRREASKIKKLTYEEVWESLK